MKEFVRREITKKINGFTLDMTINVVDYYNVKREDEECEWWTLEGETIDRLTLSYEEIKGKYQERYDNAFKDIKKKYDLEA